MRLWKSAAVAVCILACLNAPTSAQRGGRGGAPADSFPTNIPPETRASRRSSRKPCAWWTACRTLTQQIVDQLFSFSELGMQEIETREVPDRAAGEERLQGRARRRGHADRVGRDVGHRQAGDRARLRHRRHSAGEPEAGRRYRDPIVAGAPGHGEGHNSGRR